ncbi:hypothetical protein QF028_004074 [Neobacillus sp. B4I6]
MMWIEETQGKRINVERTEQALQLNPTMIGSNCPNCLKVKKMDIAEIVERSLAG